MERTTLHVKCKYVILSSNYTDYCVDNDTLSEQRDMFDILTEQDH